MVDKNKIKLLIGLFFIVASFICAIIILYFMGNKSRADLERLASLEVRLANLMTEKGQYQMKLSDRERVRREPISLEDFLAQAESIYGPEELKRKEGILWIDRKGSVCMVNLGIVNGLEAGSSLSIYDGNNKVGDLMVETPLDIISYVKPVDKSLDELTNSYYRVVINQ